MFDFDWFFIQIFFIFLFAGFVKGLVGFGFPMIIVGLMSIISDLKFAISIILIPGFLSNLFQIYTLSSPIILFNKIRIFLFSALILIPVGVNFLVNLPLFPFEKIVGFIIIIYSIFCLRGYQFPLNPGYFKIVGVIAGLLNSLLTGMTACSSMPGIVYFRAIGLVKNEIIGALGMLFFLSTLVLGLSLWWQDQLTVHSNLISLALCLPAGVGVLMGYILRKRTNERFFNIVFLMVFSLLGTYLIFFGD